MKYMFVEWKHTTTWTHKDITSTFQIFNCNSFQLMCAHVGMRLISTMINYGKIFEIQFIRNFYKYYNFFVAIPKFNANSSSALQNIYIWPRICMYIMDRWMYHKVESNMLFSFNWGNLYCLKRWIRRKLFIFHN